MRYIPNGEKQSKRLAVARSASRTFFTPLDCIHYSLHTTEVQCLPISSARFATRDSKSETS